MKPREEVLEYGDSGWYGAGREIEGVFVINNLVPYVDIIDKQKK